MNVENINERLLRTERERDEALRLSDYWEQEAKRYCADNEVARAELARLRKLETSLPASLRDAHAELARLRAAANERAITELEWALREESLDYVSLLRDRIAALRAETPAAPQPAPSGGVERAIARLNDLREWAGGEEWSNLDGYAIYRRVVDRIDADIVELRAEQQAAPVPPPVTHCEFCNGSLADGTDGHGLGECVPVCPTCDGSGTAKPPATSGWLHDLAFLGFAPNGRMSYGVNRFGDGAAGNPVFDLDFADLQRELRRILAQPPVTPPADAPSRPSAVDLRFWQSIMEQDTAAHADVRRAVWLLLADALAGRGEGAE